MTHRSPHGARALLVAALLLAVPLAPTEAQSLPPDPGPTAAAPPTQDTAEVLTLTAPVEALYLRECAADVALADRTPNCIMVRVCDVDANGVRVCSWTCIDQALALERHATLATLATMPLPPLTSLLLTAHTPSDPAPPVPHQRR